MMLVTVVYYAFGIAAVLALLACAVPVHWWDPLIERRRNLPGFSVRRTFSTWLSQGAWRWEVTWQGTRDDMPWISTLDGYARTRLGAWFAAWHRARPKAAA